jgi:hypothetical protein
MSTDGGGGAPAGNLQFEKAEFGGSPPARACAQCQKPIADEYFEVGGHMICRSCSAQFTRGGRLLPALGYGVGAALVGTLVWYAVIALFNMELGIIAIGIGLLVGMAVRKGSGGIGGAKFQALAMALTYLSITFSYVPLVLKGMAEGVKQSEQASQDKSSSGGSLTGKPPSEQESAPAEKGAPQGDKGAPTFLGLALFCGLVFGLALASPFLAGAENIIGILIIGIALYEAWKLNRGVRLQGPFRLAATPAPPAASAG